MEINKEKFYECWENADTEDKVYLWNECASDQYPDDQIFPNDEEFFNMFFEDKPFEAVRATFFGKYNFSDQYIWFNGYGNIESSDFADEMPIDVDELYDYLVDNPELLDYHDAFSDAFEEDHSKEDDEDTEE